MITRQLDINDFLQVMEMFEERFSTTIEFDKNGFSHLKDEPGFAEFRETFFKNKRKLIFDFLKDQNKCRLFGTFDDDGLLLSMVEMRIVSETEWVLDNLKSRKIPNNGMRETFILLLDTAKKLNLKSFTYCVAASRYEKFVRFFKSVIADELFNSYTTVEKTIIPAGSMENPEFPVGSFGNRIPLVDLMFIKRVINE